jgi:elongation factor Ts
MMECKKALVEASGDLEKAKEWLRVKGIAKAEKKEGRATGQGAIGIYQHHDGRKAVMIEVNCETDFVARNEKFIDFAGDLAKHVMALRPEFVSREEVPQDDIKREEDLIRAESAEELAKKPEAAQAKILEGRMRKYFEQRCLLDQKFVLEESKTVEQVVKEQIASLGENIKVRRFARLEVGEE